MAEEIEDGDDERGMLATLHQYQTTGYLCDLTLVSCEGVSFMAHAGVMAAASSILADKLSDCECGNYKIIMPMNYIQIKQLIKFAYTGEKNPHLGSAADWDNFCGLDSTLSHESSILSRLLDFSERGLFCNMAWEMGDDEMQPAHSFLMAAKYEFLSKHVRSDSFVTVISANTTPKEYVAWKASDHPLELSNQSGKSSADCTSRLARTREVEGARSYKCKTCHKTFRFKHNFARHKRCHNCDRRFECATCDKVFNRDDKLQAHERVHAGQMPYRCTTCNKAFPKRCQLTKHKRVHIDYKPYVCETCNKGFTRLSYLRGHEYTHTGCLPYICPKCQKGFTRKGDLKRHDERIHNAPPSYVCDVCQQAFTKISLLKRHSRDHSGENNYKCPTCEKPFKLKRDMMRHERIHTGDKPFTCFTCLTSFRRKDHLLNHYRSKAHVT